MEIDYVAIGKRIQKARKKKHMTQRVLAESVDISASHLSNIERGTKPVGLLTLLKICNALNITADSVLIDNYEQNAEAVEAASTSFREYRQKDRELATKVMETIMKLIDDYK